MTDFDDIEGGYDPKNVETIYRRAIKERDARIAELEAALKEAEELLSDAYANTGRGDYGLGCIAARAALGEKE